MGRIGKVVFGIASYSIFLMTFLYAIGFTGQVVVPKNINDGAVVGALEAVAVNVLLLTLFAAQHSIMARPAFKRFWTRIVPEPIERSTYVLLASLALVLLFWQWRPLPTVVWSTHHAFSSMAIEALFWVGWGLVLISTFLISHFELFGVRQVLVDWAGKTLPAPIFRTPLLYRYIRHPIYLGFLMAFWSTPTMTLGHLLFSAVTTAYILVGIQLEERDLVRFFGTAYTTYRQQVGMLLPVLWRSKPQRRAAEETFSAGP